MIPLPRMISNSFRINDKDEQRLSKIIDNLRRSKIAKDDLTRSIIDDRVRSRIKKIFINKEDLTNGKKRRISRRNDARKYE